MNIHRSATTLCVLLAVGAAHAQLAKGATKFLGNITTNGAVRTDFGTYWNQITPENESKWGSVEYTRGTFDWSGVDRVANYAKQQGIPWKFHTLVWGGQYPTWMDNLSQADQLTEITKWFDAAAARYPDVPMIDVVNEAMVGHNPAPFKNALGGDGASGVDWIVTAFKMARARWPKATLIYNDFNILEWNYADAVTFISKMVKAGAPVDAIGSQSHALTSVDSATFHSRIDGMVAATGLPMYITEFDIDAADDATQKDYYSKLFPVMWNHPSVAGVTLWGYIAGKTWETNSGLMSDANVDRPAMTWLKSYVASHQSPPVPKVGPATTTDPVSSAGGVCDIYAKGGTPCVAAFSSTRALYSAYAGNLYQVRRPDGKTQDIKPLTAGGLADAAAQDAFCTVAGSCRISIIYDQSGKGNHLTKAPAGNKSYGPYSDSEAVADALPIQMNGKKVYGVHITPGGWTTPGQVGYRNTATNGIAKGDDPESMYMVTDGTYVNGACCFDFGNAEMDPLIYTSMDAIYFGTNNWWDVGSGTGPWIMADLENGVFNHDGATGTGRVVLNSNDKSLAYPFVTALLKNNKAGATGGPFTIKGGNAQSGALTTMWDGARPDGYGSLGKAGGIVLGIGGDNSSGAQGNFYEGVMTTGFASSAVDDAVQANIVAAGYGNKNAPAAGATFYQYANYAGLNAKLTAGSYTAAQLLAAGIPDNTIASMQVDAGLTVTLYDGDNFQTPLGSFTSGVADFATIGAASKVTSLKITVGTVSVRASQQISGNGVRWSEGALHFAGMRLGRVQITDPQGRSRVLDVMEGQALTGLLPRGVYACRILNGSADEPRSFVVLP
jgi:non-reducing end alpha-L-arabinofuranosidase